MRIQTLIVKSIITIACLLIPSEVFAADNGKSEDHPGRPAQNVDLPEAAENSSKGNTDKENPSENGQSQKDEHADDHANDDHGVDVAVKADVGLQHSNGEENRSIHADVKKENRSTQAQTDVNKQHKNTQSKKSEQSADSPDHGAAVHSDHSRNELQKQEPESSINSMDNSRTTAETKAKAERDTDNLKSSTDEPSQHKDPKPIPTDSDDHTPQQTPVVIPAQHVLNVSKSGGQNGDGQSSSSSNGFTFYGIASFGDGPLISLVNDYSNEMKRKHNQWINAPPSPPPKSNLLSQ